MHRLLPGDASAKITVHSVGRIGPAVTLDFLLRGKRVRDEGPTLSQLAHLHYAASSTKLGF
jgi:hypothetical protein